MFFIHSTGVWLLSHYGFSVGRQGNKPGFCGANKSHIAWQKMGGKQPCHILCFPTSPIPIIRMELRLYTSAYSQHTTSSSLYMPRRCISPLSAVWDLPFNQISLRRTYHLMSLSWSISYQVWSHSTLVAVKKNEPPTTHFRKMTLFFMFITH